MKTESYSCPLAEPCCPLIKLSESCSICNLCSHCYECNQCPQCYQFLISENNKKKFLNSNISPSQIQFQEQEKKEKNIMNNYKLQIFNKDKVIMNYTKQIEQQNNKLEALNNSLKIKDKQILQLQNTIKELNLNIENLKKELSNNNELIEKYKYEIENQIQTSEHNQNIYDDNYNTMNIKLEENKNRINELEQINSKLNANISQLKKDIYSKNEIIENKNIISTKLSNENRNLPLMNKKLIEYENSLKILQDENANSKKYNLDLLNENKNLNQKLNQLLKEINEKENNFNMEIYNINSKLNEVEQEFKNTSEELEKSKLEKESLIQNQENYNNFLNNKLNEINEFIILVFNTSEINKLSEELNKIIYMGENKSDSNSKDIKYELVENSISEIKKNILKFVLNIKEKSDKYINEYNNISKDKEILEIHKSEIETELNIYRQNKNEIENKNKEITLNYEQLKDSYSKLYKDYNIFTRSNEKYANEMQNFFLELIEKIKNTLGDKNIYRKEAALNEILKDCISKLLEEYKLMIKKIEENDKKEKITYYKIMELGKLLEEAQKIGKEYEIENRRLKQEIEKLNYRYNLLKASIDTVEYKIKTDS